MVEGTGTGTVQHEGYCLLVSSPSGAGKTTLLKGLMQRYPRERYYYSVSATTRRPRENERDGVDYHFITQDEFDRYREQGDFLEHAHVHGESYGTLRQPIVDAVRSGKLVLLDVDYQGALQLKKNTEFDIVSVFILPPSLHALKQRLIERQHGFTEAIAERLQKARVELKYASDYDYVLINAEANVALEQLIAICEAEQRKTSRFIALKAYVSRLVKEGDRL